MSMHVIVGAGPVGAATATLLAERGEQVRIVSRRGIGPEHPAIERVAADAADADRLSSLTAGAAALRLSSFLCKRLLILCWGPGSSALNGVPVLAAVKPGRQSGLVVGLTAAARRRGWPGWRNPAVRGRRLVTRSPRAGRGRPG